MNKDKTVIRPSNLHMHAGKTVSGCITVTWDQTSPASRLFAQPFVPAQIKEDIKAPRYWPLLREFTAHRWIPPTKGQ